MVEMEEGILGYLLGILGKLLRECVACSVQLWETFWLEHNQNETKVHI